MDVSTNKFIICSYFTPGYEKVAREYLIDSLKNFDMEYDISKVESLGNWYQNTAYKPRFIQEMLSKHPNKNIVLVDCDAQIEKFPTLFNNIPEECILAAHFLDHDNWYRNNSHKVELLTGTLFIKNCPTSELLLEVWRKECSLNPKTWEQKILQKLVADQSIPIYQLPLNYCYIDTLPSGEKPYVKCDDVIIRHFQHSRKVNKNV